MPEIVFESLQFALETTRGTAIAAPTHRLNMEGTIEPVDVLSMPAANIGLLAGANGSEFARAGSSISGTGPLDAVKMPLICAMALDGSVTTGVGAGTNKLWTFNRKMTSDNLKSATGWWGDPNISGAKIFKAPFCMLEELSFESEVGSEDGAQMSIKGSGQDMDDVAIPALAAAVATPILSGILMQVWIDPTTNAFGTTALTNRVLYASHTIPTGRTYKYQSTGPGAAITYTDVGIMSTIPSMKLRVELKGDLAEWDTYQARLLRKIRVRYNGPIIATTERYFVEVDMIGRLKNPKWGVLEGSNRTLELDLDAEYDATAATDVSVKVQNISATI